MTDRRHFLALASGLLAVPNASRAQRTPARIYQIGFLSSETSVFEARRLEILRSGLRELGYAEGTTFQIETRFAEGKYERLQALAKELVDAKVDVIVASGSKAGAAAKAATLTVPIVVSNMGDAVDAQFVGNFARHGGNVTGMSALGSESLAKQLDVLKQLKPQVRTVAVLLNPANPNSNSVRQILKGATESQRIALEIIETRKAEELPAAFAALERKRIEALVVVSDTMFGAHAKTIADLSLNQKVASIGTFDFAHAGGLLGYSSNRTESWRQLVPYVDKILKGAKPADLPIAQPTKVVLVVNLRTAKALGVDVPQSLLLRADEVIR